MSLAPGHAENDRASTSAAVLGTVRWGQGPLYFELRSSDAAIVSRAATIMSSWPPAPRARLARSWTVERATSPEGGGLWEAHVSDPGDESERLFRRLPSGALIQAIELDAVRQLIAYPEATLGLHGALLSKQHQEGDRGVALIGPCLAGKSTLSCALWNSGWSFLSDDVTLFDIDGQAYPAPRRASMRDTSRGLIGETLWARARTTPSCDDTPKGMTFHPHEIDGQPRPHHSRLSAIIFLARRNVQIQPAELRRVVPVQAAIALVPYSNLLPGMSFPEALTRMAPLAERVPAYDLGRAPLPAMIARLDALIETSIPV